jgi:hypothetical protein
MRGSPVVLENELFPFTKGNVFEKTGQLIFQKPRVNFPG